jgi:hypothetical protein
MRFAFARRLAVALLATIVPVPRTAGAQGVWRGPDSALVAAIRGVVEQHHPSVVSGDARETVVWIVTDAQYNYRWSAVDAHATWASMLARAKRAELIDAIARLRLAEQDHSAEAPDVKAARANLDRIVRDLRRHATRAADVSRVDITALPDFLDTDDMAQSLATWIYPAGVLGPGPLKVTVIRLKPDAS